MDVHTEKSRLLNILNGQSVDRPSVICPGGMMNAAVTEVVEPIIKSRGGRGNHNIHSKDMVEAARRVHDQTGFENYGVPFCMTAEVEPLGIQTDYGDAFMEPRVTQYTELSIDAIVRKGRVNVLEYPRMKAVVEAIDLLKNESIPVIGNITGHISTASSAVDPNVFFKSLIKTHGQPCLIGLYQCLSHRICERNGSCWGGYNCYFRSNSNGRNTW